MQFRAAALIVACASVGPLAAGQRDVSSEQGTDHSSLTGTWQINEAESRLGAENWHDRLKSYRRPQAPCLPTLTRPGEPVTYACKDAYQLPQAGPTNMVGEGALSTFGRPLLEASQTLTIAVAGSSVTIGGSLLETRTYHLDGKPETVQVIVNHSPRWPSTRPMSVATQWVGASLAQEKKTAFSGVTVALTETYLPADNGQQLFLLIDVKNPTLKPPIKPIKRMYVRSKSIDKF